MTTSPTLDDAVTLHGAQPWPLGPALNLARVFSQGGQRETALEFMSRYAARFGVAGKAAEALVTVAERSPVVRLAPGEVVVREGERSDTVYVVLSGLVEVDRDGPGRLATLGKGQSFGEIAALAGTPRTATVTAREPTELLGVSRKILGQLVQYFPPLEQILSAVYRDRLLSQLVPPGSLFSSLDANRRHELFTRFVPLTRAAGEVLLREGQEGIGFGIVVSGQVKVWRYALGRRVETLGKLGPGDVFGEVSMLYEMPAMATLEALSVLTTYVLPREVFHDFVKRCPEEAQKLQALARQRLGYTQTGPSLDVGTWAFGIRTEAVAHLDELRERPQIAGLPAEMPPLADATGASPP